MVSLRRLCMPRHAGMTMRTVPRPWGAKVETNVAWRKFERAPYVCLFVKFLTPGEVKPMALSLSRGSESGICRYRAQLESVTFLWVEGTEPRGVR